MSKRATEADVDESFNDIVRPVIQWLCTNRCPYHTIIVTSTGASLMEDQCSTGDVFDYIEG